MSKNNMYACECGCKQIVCGECKRFFGVDEEHECKMVEKKESTMNEKVKLPKDVCDVLESLDISVKNSDVIRRSVERTWSGKYYFMNKIDIDLLMRALVLGYEPELSEEEKAKKLFFDCNEKQFAGFDGPYTIVYRLGIIDGLRTHGIHYDWMEDAE